MSTSSWGPLSELYGRTVVLQTTNLMYLGFNLGCGLSKTKAQLIAFRFMSGLGGSAPLAIGGGVLGDLFDAEQRGRAISIYSLMPMLGPAIGPIGKRNLPRGCLAKILTPQQPVPLSHKTRRYVNINYPVLFTPSRRYQLALAMDYIC